MPEVRDLTNFRLNEYMWCSTYKTSDITKETPDHDCPCEVEVTTITHIQENLKGFENEDEQNHNTALICEDFMSKFNLKIGNKRGFIFDENNKVAVVDSSYLNSDVNGLYVRKDLLDKYLCDNKKALVMCVLGDKNIYGGLHITSNIDLTGYYYYTIENGYQGSIRKVDKTVIDK